MKIIEFNTKFQRANDTLTFGKNLAMITPPVGQDYWLFRVNLFTDQAILGFPKFGTIGIGFAIEEENWNTNLPYSCSPEQIFYHIRVNKKYKEITKADCIQAITSIIEQCEAFKMHQQQSKTNQIN